jgi:sulfate adenylyltransferase/3'-phosphoadenosine 5'-phosphosulfate synthase
VSGFVVWFTGLSGAGKSTLAALLAAELRHRGVHVEVLDGDEVRTHLSRGLGFSREDRDTNVRRIGFVAKLIARSGGCAMTAAISPYRAVRDEQRAQIERFVEVYCRCEVPVLAARDPKGLYQKALAGEIKHFTGVDDPYEPPERPEVIVDTGVESKEESLGRILATLEALGYVGALGKRAQGALIAPHGGELVDRYAHDDERASLLADAAKLVAIDLDARAERDVEGIASGALSPLKGFMGSKDYLRVTREMRLENGLVWPVPVTLAIRPEEAARVAVGARVALRARDGSIVAVLDVADKWSPEGSVCIGGEIRALGRPGAGSPRETRAIFAERGWSRVAAFRADGVMRRAEEHITKAALEVCDGLFVEASAEGALPLDLRLRCHEALFAAYYPAARVVLGVDRSAAPRASAEREALMRAIWAKNHGASHLILERSKVPAAVFDDLAPGELGIAPLLFEDAFWSAAVGGMATVKTAPDGPAPYEELRPEVARLLAG